MIDRSISHYRITSKLGSGGMGVVYEAEDTNLGRRVALKFLPPEMAKDDAALQRFQREARAASALNHPNICTIHAIEQHETEYFISMELLEGDTLADTIRRGPVDVPALVNLAVQIADALESAHAKGIVHRDLKPANIFITARGQAKVLDFGLAKIDRRANEGSMVMTAVRDELTSAGTALGTISYMSPEQARGQITDARTDIFSLGTVLYQMATGVLPFQGDTSAVVFDAILNREPPPITYFNAALPAGLQRLIEKALEKDRDLRYQSAAELKTDLNRVRRDIDSGSRRISESSSGRTTAARDEPKSVAVLYFENLSGAKDDEYFRDGVTEDIITELSNIKSLQVFSRAIVLPYRDKEVPASQIGQQHGAAYALTGTIRRAGNRLRINAQLVDTRTDFPVWSKRYDTEMKDVFEVQDEIARSIAEAMRVTLSPQEEQALAVKPTENMQAYDVYLRGRNYTRRLGRQDLEFALQMFENAVSLDPQFTLAHAGIASACALYYFNFERSASWIDRARLAAERASTRGQTSPEVLVALSWVAYGENRLDDALDLVRRGLQTSPDVENGYYLLGRLLFAMGRYQELLEISEQALAHTGENYNTLIPIGNALEALGKTESLRNFIQRSVEFFEAHLQKVPEDARARVLLAGYYTKLNRTEEAASQGSLAMTLRPNDALVLYNVACLFCGLKRVEDAMVSLRKAWDAGYRDTQWTRSDPDLAPLHGHPEFERLYPAPQEKR
jgi:serine/threonine protein kinase/Tfp pilus assembly protein PilF